MPSANVDAPVNELTTSFQARFHRAPNLGDYQDRALAINTWLSTTHPGQFLGGFWNGEQGTNALGEVVYGIVCVGS